MVSVVFLAYNRREKLLESIGRMRDESGYPLESLEIVVVDNASEDGTAGAVRERFPDAVVIENPANVGAPGWNPGFRAARGEYVLILDDDAYLTPGGLEEAVRVAAREKAALVSFTVLSSEDPSYSFNREYRTGLLSYWGCSALVSKRALGRLGGYDPNIFIWANELDLTIRLLDAGFRHAFAPDIRAVHMKAPPQPGLPLRSFRINARHYAYVAGKLMRIQDALAVVGNRAAQTLVQTLVGREDGDRQAFRAFPDLAAGLLMGLRNRAPVRPSVSIVYRRHYHSFAGPWRVTRTPRERWAARRGGAGVAEQRRGRHSRFYDERPQFYPVGRGTLSL